MIYKSIHIVFENDMMLRGFEDKASAENYIRTEKILDEKAYANDLHHRPSRFHIQPVMVEMI